MSKKKTESAKKSESVKDPKESGSFRHRKLKSFRIPEGIDRKMRGYSAALGVKPSRLWDKLFQMFYEEAKQGAPISKSGPDIDPDTDEKELVTFRLDSDIAESIQDLSKGTGVSEGKIAEIVFNMFHGKLIEEVDRSRVTGRQIRKRMADRLMAEVGGNERWFANSRTKGSASAKETKAEAARRKAREAKGSGKKRG